MIKDEVKKITLTFIKFLQGYEDAYLYSNDELTELFRYCLCYNLGLESSYVFDGEKYKRIVNRCKAELKPVLDEYKDLKDEEKTDIVQLCMHYIVKSWKKAGV